MDDLKNLFFAEPLALYLALGLAELVTLAVLYKRRSRRSLVAALVPILLAAVVAALAAIITTERERLVTALDELARAAQEGDMGAAAPWIDQTYFDGLYDRADLLDVVALAKQIHAIRSVRVSGVEIRIDGEEAVAAFMATIGMKDPGIGRDAYPTRWRLWWVRRKDGWRLVSAQLDQPAGLPGSPRGPKRRPKR